MATLWIVSPLAGALAWLAAQGYIGTQIDHLDIACIHANDVVVGTLPANYTWLLIKYVHCNGQAKQDSYLGSLSKKITFKL